MSLKKSITWIPPRKKRDIMAIFRALNNKPAVKRLMKSLADK